MTTDKTQPTPSQLNQSGRGHGSDMAQRSAQMNGLQTGERIVQGSREEFLKTHPEEEVHTD